MSLPSAGVRFPAVDVREFEAQIPDFTSDQLQQLLDVWSAFYDLSTYQFGGTRDTVGPADRKMIAEIKARVKHSSGQSAVAAVCDSNCVERGQKRKRPRRAEAFGPYQQGHN